MKRTVTPAPLSGYATPELATPCLQKHILVGVVSIVFYMYRKKEYCLHKTEVEDGVVLVPYKQHHVPK